MSARRVNDAAIVADYVSGMSWQNIQDKYACAVTTVYDVLVRNGIKRKREEEKSWTQSQNELFTQMYYSNCTYSEIGAAFNIKSSTITWHVHRLGLKMRGSGRNNTWANKFSEGTPESDYWLGYILADGHITNNLQEHTYVVSLFTEKDYVVTRYKEWFGYKMSVHRRKYTTLTGEQHTMYNASIYSKDIADWFTYTLGVASKKHHNLNPKLTLNWDILRGFFDGDGTCGHYRWGLTSCSIVWLERIQKFLADAEIKSSISTSTKGCYKLFVYSKSNLSKLLKNLYANSYYCHEYKYQNLVNLVAEMPRRKSSELLEA